MSYDAKRKGIRAFNLKSITAKPRKNHRRAEGGEKQKKKKKKRAVSHATSLIIYLLFLMMRLHVGEIYIQEKKKEHLKKVTVL